MDRLELFKTELNYIKDPKIREFAEKTLLKLPDYFFEVAASSTAKYHSPVCLGNGGLVRHTKMNVTFAVDLLYNVEMFSSKYTDIEKDIVVAVEILHDGTKHGLSGSKYSVAEHPAVLANFIRQNFELRQMLDETVLDKIIDGIETHMGAFNKDYRTKKEILPKPHNGIENFIHLCDYLGSRKYIKDFDFDINVIRD
jgi:hypothetical protein